MTLDQLLERVLDPQWGSLVIVLAVLYFLWKLYREEQAEARDAWAMVREQTEAMRELARVVTAAFREAEDR